MSGPEPLFAGVELGGTKCIAVIARDRQILERAHWPTGDDPTVTLAAIADWLTEQTRRYAVAALGIASFGPIGLARGSETYGTILDTPKPGWSGADVVATLSRGFAGPVGFDTDVAAAALAEGRWGASVGCAVHAYITIGTGIGAGIVIAGHPHRGIHHPEIGHVPVRRQLGDSFSGVCPIHGDCLEGLASGPAIAARAGRPAQDLAQDHPIWDAVIDEIADMLSSLILTLSPQRIVIGGGVGYGQAWLLPRLHLAVARTLNGYLPAHSRAALSDLIVAPSLGADAGVYGSVALAILEQETLP
ncbi:ROK family protein [Sphingomonas glacialis]|uniref:fructokinase n=1 Tax=Sphingomonas glacialis TaxID=658225 RepID=A0A502G4J1_9SPHN|nr:ROK family protein [Sphingomonas glacialis]TPG56390.1 ROK family protein [Sphingomonas glacialis]